MTYGSDQVCAPATATEGEQKYQVRVAIECSDEYELEGEAHVVKVIDETSCSPIILVNHSAGCPDYYVSDFTWLNYWKPQILGSMITLMGLGFGCIGKKMFAIFSGLTVSFFINLCIIYSITAYTDWLRSLPIFVVTIVGLSAFAVLLTLCLKRRRFFPITITCIGVLTGFFIGNLAYIIVYCISGLESFSTAMTFLLSIIVFFAIVSYTNGKSLLGITQTLSLLGGVMFTRGLSLLIGGYPIDSV